MCSLKVFEFKQNEVFLVSFFVSLSFLFAIVQPFNEDLSVLKSLGKTSHFVKNKSVYDSKTNETTFAPTRTGNVLTISETISRTISGMNAATRPQRADIGRQLWGALQNGGTSRHPNPQFFKAPEPSNVPSYSYGQQEVSNVR